MPAPLPLLLSLTAMLAVPQALAAPPPGHPRVAAPDITLFELIAADVAAHRGELEFASDAWLDVASSRRSTDAAELAWQAAVTGHDPERMRKAASLWLTLDPEAENARLTMLADAVAADDGARIRNEVAMLSSIAGKREKGADQGSWLVRLLNTLNRSARREPGLATLADAVSREVRKFPDRADVRIGLGRLLLTLGRGTEACREVSSAVLPEGDAELLGQAADVCWPTSGEETRRMIERHLSRHPDDIQAHLLLGRIELRLGHRTKAAAELTRATRRLPDDARLAASAGELALDLGDAAAAERLLSRQVEILRKETEDADLSHLETWLRLGNAALLQQAPERAAGYYAELTGGPFALQARIREALALADAGQGDEALEVLRRARSDLPSETPALRTAELRLLLELSRPDEALRAAEEAVAAHPDDADLLYEAAMVNEELGRHDVAERNLRTLLASHPAHVQGANALGYLLADSNRNLKEARELLERAYAATPLDPYILDSMGWLCYREGRLRSAAEFVLNSLKRLWDSDVAAHLVEILARSERTQEAAEVLSELRRHGEEKLAETLAGRFGLTMPAETNR